MIWAAYRRSKPRPQVMWALWAFRLKSPTAAPANALKRTEQECKSEALALCCSLLEVMPSEDEDDLFSSDEEGERSVLNSFRDLLCLHMQAAWLSERCWKVRNEVLLK